MGGRHENKGAKVEKRRQGQAGRVKGMELRVRAQRRGRAAEGASTSTGVKPERAIRRGR